jgi:hypothetical protein
VEGESIEVVDKVYEIVDQTAKALDLQVGEKLVIRLWSWTCERLVRDAAMDHDIAERLGRARPYNYSISTFALARGHEESVSALIDRLVAYVGKLRRAKYYCLITESELTSAGFGLVESRPPDHHYEIPLGDETP